MTSWLLFLFAVAFLIAVPFLISVPLAPILFAVPFLILVPLAPKLVRLRIRFFRWLRWAWTVNLLESHFQGWVLFFRTILSVIAAALLYFGWTQR